MKRLSLVLVVVLISIFSSCRKNPDSDFKANIPSNKEALRQIKMCLDISPDSVNVKNGPSTSATSVDSKVWNNGKVLRVIFQNGDSYLHNKVIQYARQWEDYANIQFEFVTSGYAEIRVGFISGIGSWSLIGKDSERYSVNTQTLATYSSKYGQTMNFGWFDSFTPDYEFSRTIIHEFGHALGLIHEHQSPESNIPWNKPAVYQYYLQTQGWNQQDVDYNIFQKYSASITQYTQYDVNSIMHYPIDPSLTDGIFQVGLNTTLSSMDKSHINWVYPTVAGFSVMPAVWEVRASLNSYSYSDMFPINTSESPILTSDGTSSIWSDNGEFRITMQTDGNLVIYKKDATPIWWSDTHNPDQSWKYRLYFASSDGNLVITRWKVGLNEETVWSAVSAAPSWTPRSHNAHRAYWQMQNDGNFVMYYNGMDGRQWYASFESETAGGTLSNRIGRLYP